MSDNNSKGVEIPSKQYQQAAECVDLMRDALTGSPAIKSDEKRKKYLPPSTLGSKWSYEETVRYNRYVNRAEYDNVPSNTVSSLIGGMFRKPIKVNKLPNQIAMLEDNVDGDGLTLQEQMKVAASELLQMNYIFMLAEFVGLADVDIKEISVADSKNAQPAIKLYTRESIIGWQYSRINGVLQLAQIRLRQCEEVQDGEGFEQKQLDSYLVLSLDENGNYFQQKYIGGEIDEWSEPHFPLANGEMLKYIPGEFCIAEEVNKGDIPLKMGYLYDIAVKSIARYQVNADLKEALYFSGAPFTTSSGWDSQAQELYQSMTGHDCIMALPGTHLPMPDGVTFDIKSWSGEGAAIFKYLQQNEAEIRALGGVFDTTEGDAEQTATAASIKAAEKQGVLTQVVDSLESCFAKVMQYCGEFAGVSNAQVEIVMNKEFSEAKLSPQERAQILNEFTQGLIPASEALSQLERGGALTEGAEQIILRSSRNIDSLENA